MEQLFEEYTQIVLQEELDSLANGVQYETNAPLRVEQNPSLKPFEDSERIDHEPDHLLCAGDEPVVVLDTKYYAADDDPTADAYTRSRMFAYGFLLDLQQMAFLTPLAEPQTRILREGGNVKVVSANGAESFSVGAYRQAIQSYLHELLDGYITYAEDYDQLLIDVRERIVHIECRDDYTDADDSTVWQVITNLEPEQNREGRFARYITKAIGRSYAPVDYRSLGRHDRRRVKERLRDMILAAPDKTDYILPAYVPKEEIDDLNALVETDCEHDHEYDDSRMSIIRMYALMDTAEGRPQILDKKEAALRWRLSKQHRR
jgi:hypothetical protein